MRRDWTAARRDVTADRLNRFVATAAIASVIGAAGLAATFTLPMDLESAGSNGKGDAAAATTGGDSATNPLRAKPPDTSRPGSARQNQVVPHTNSHGS